MSKCVKMKSVLYILEYRNKKNVRQFYDRRSVNDYYYTIPLWQMRKD